ncbi:acyl-CoA dehydrogenase family protein [Rhodococcus koreensis]
MSVDLVELTDEQTAIRELCQSFARSEVRPIASRIDEADHEMAWDLWRKATEVGLTTYMLPKEVGGDGLTDVFTSALVYEELCWGDVGLGQLITSNGFHTLPVLTLGSDAQRERWMPRTVGLDAKPTAIAITEPSAGSDSAAMKSHARPVDGGYRLNGQKAWISNGQVADFIVVFATVDPSLGAKGITAFVVEPDDEGLTIGAPMKKMGQRGMLCNELFFDDIFLPSDRRLGEEGAAFAGLMSAFEKSRTLVAAGSVGLARAAYEYTRDYAKERTTFGKRIIDHQAIGFRLADMATRIEAARMMVWRAAKTIDAGESGNVESAMAKVFASETAMFCAWSAVQTLGGWGYSREYPAEKWMRDAKLDEIGEGTSEILRLIISRSLARG